MIFIPVKTQLTIGELLGLMFVFARSICPELKHPIRAPPVNEVCLFKLMFCASLFTIHVENQETYTMSRSTVFSTGSVLPGSTLTGAILAGSFCLTSLISPAALAVAVTDIPNPQQESGTWVTDTAEILSDEAEVQLNQMITELEANNGTEMAVVTVPQTAPSDSPKAFATELFNYWGIGKAEQDNGVLFLISVNDRRVEIETGYGLATLLPDAEVARIIDSEITPRFRQGDFDGGALAGTQTIATALSDTVPSPDSSNASPIEQTAQPETPSTQGFNDLDWGAVLGGIVLLVFMGLSALSFIHIFNPRSHRRSTQRQNRSTGDRTFWGEHYGSSNTGSSDAGSSGGGFGGDFGGGSSGGGGAGGSF